MAGERLPIVWHATPLPARHRLDLTPLRGYGALRNVFSQWPTVASDDENDAELEAWLREYDPEMDYVVVLPTDDPHAALLMGAALSHYHESVQVLRWDRRTEANGERTRHGYYVPVNMRLP